MSRAQTTHQIRNALQRADASLSDARIDLAKIDRSALSPSEEGRLDAIQMHITRAKDELEKLKETRTQ